MALIFTDFPTGMGLNHEQFLPVCHSVHVEVCPIAYWDTLPPPPPQPRSKHPPRDQRQVPPWTRGRYPPGPEAGTPPPPWDQRKAPPLLEQTPPGKLEKFQHSLDTTLWQVSNRQYWWLEGFSNRFTTTLLKCVSLFWQIVLALFNVMHHT